MACRLATRGVPAIGQPRLLPSECSFHKGGMSSERKLWRVSSRMSGDTDATIPG